MNKYELVEMPTINIRRREGLRIHRRVHLVINGAVFKAYHEDTKQVEHLAGEHFDEFIMGEVKRLMQFFPGTLIHREEKYLQDQIKDTTTCEQNK